MLAVGVVPRKAPLSPPPGRRTGRSEGSGGKADSKRCPPGAEGGGSREAQQSTQGRPVVVPRGALFMGSRRGRLDRTHGGRPARPAASKGLPRDARVVRGRVAVLHAHVGAE